MVPYYADKEQLDTAAPDYSNKETVTPKLTSPRKVKQSALKLLVKDSSRRNGKSATMSKRLEKVLPMLESNGLNGDVIGKKPAENGRKHTMKHEKHKKPKRKLGKTSSNKKKKYHWERPSTTPEIIQSYGYQTQAHEIITKDGYILTVFRIVVNFKLVVTNTSKAVLLHHGLSGNSADWLLGGSESLPFLLARQGYDVWLANARGTIYSKAHMKHSVHSEKFWNFSFYEIGEDIMPVLAYIKSLIGTLSRLYFIGHSMGATSFLAVMSIHPEYQDLVKMAVMLAPLAFMRRTTGPLKSFSEINTSTLLSLLGLKDCPVRHIVYSLFIKDYCSTLRNVCDTPLLFMTNATATIHNTETLEMVMMRGQSDMSMRTLIHFLQLIQSGEFQSFDWGDGEPWRYHMDLMRVPTAVFASDSDIVAPTWDVARLATRLSNILLLRTVQSSNFGHMDFVWGFEAYSLLYPSILALLETNDY